MDPKPEEACKCEYRWKRGEVVRVVNPRCPEHGRRGHLQIVP